jgi:hypothetical protein
MVSLIPGVIRMTKYGLKGEDASREKGLCRRLSKNTSMAPVKSFPYHLRFD